MSAKDQYLSNLAIWISSVLAAAERKKNNPEEILSTANLILISAKTADEFREFSNMSAKETDDFQSANQRWRWLSDVCPVSAPF